MKHLPLLICVLLVSGLALYACNGGAGSGTPAPTVTDKNGVYLSDYLASDQFDALAAGIEDGTNLPDKLHCYFANSMEGDITDEDAILRFWQRICGVQIDITAPETDLIIDDGTAIFDFIWGDGTTVSFVFCTSEYYDDNGTLYPTVPKALVSSIFKEAYDEIEMASQPAPANNVVGPEAITDVGSDFYWDADGDGTAEYFDIYYADNGDEAPSCITIGLVADGDVSVVLDGAYGIEKLEGATDSDGLPLLVVTFYQGDFYSHDTLATATIKMQDGTLVQMEG